MRKRERKGKRERPGLRVRKRERKGLRVRKRERKGGNNSYQLGTVHFALKLLNKFFLTAKLFL